MSALAIQSTTALDTLAPAPLAAPKQFKAQLAKAKTAKPAQAPPPPDAGAEPVKPEAPTQLTASSPLAIATPALTAATGGVAKPPGAPAPTTAQPASMDAASLEAVTTALPALTPLEQAVHDLIDQLGKRADPHDDAVPAAHAALGGDVTTLLHAATDLAASAPHRTAHAEAAAPLQQLADVEATAQQQAQSHVHLVLDDGDARIVMTVAVRGHEVRVSTRSTDDGTAAAIARSANSLDHALRARGLELAELAQQSEPDDSHRERRHEPRERRPPEQPRFSLEEQA